MDFESDFAFASVYSCAVEFDFPIAVSSEHPARRQGLDQSLHQTTFFPFPFRNRL